MRTRYMYIFELSSARATSVPSLIAIGRLLGQFLFLRLQFDLTSAPTHYRPLSKVDNFRPEVHSDVIFGVVVNLAGVKFHVKFGDSRSNRSGDT